MLKFNSNLLHSVRNIFLKPILLLIWKQAYLGNGEFKRDLFGYNVQDFRATGVNQMIQLKIYCPS